MADASAVAGAAKSVAAALVLEAKYLYGVEDQLRALQKDLLRMQKFIQDVDANPNLLEQGQLRISLLKIQELAFRVEDAIDIYLVNMKSKAYNKNSLLKFVWLASHLYHVDMLRKKIDAIHQEIEVVMNISENTRKSFSSICQSLIVGSSHPMLVAKNYIHLDDECVVGIKDDITRLVKRLTDPNEDFHVLGIVGTRGTGKTTLASQIYRHNKVQSSFPYRAFVSISQQWSRLDLLHHISKEILGRSDEIFSSENELIEELHEYMKDKRCFLVLDDIQKKKVWDDIYPILSRTQGLKVILATRTLEVPLYADMKCILHKPHMTDDQIWELFSKGALEGRHGAENIEFKRLGEEMLKKCYGIPLAVVTLVGLLRTKKYLYEWKEVSIALSGKIFEEKCVSSYKVVEEMLELSYLELPAHLKPLFLYLAIMPEDKVWTPNQLIRMWIAEGFVADDPIGIYETLEDKGMQFISELAQRYIIQVKKRNHRDEVELLYLHDLMREFCARKASKCQFLEYFSSTCSYKIRTAKPRRVSIFSKEHRLEKNSFLRTIVYQGLSYKLKDGVLRELESIQEDFELLKVLRISDCANKTLPEQIGNLIHLTYLSVIRTRITELPESVKKLRNLIHLEFNTVLVGGRTAKVPDDLVGSMENLRVLELPDKLPKGGSNTCKKLGLNSERHRKLHTFKCGAGKWMRKDLHANDFPTLRDLQISNIDTIEEMEAIHQCLEFLEGRLQTFRCEFNGELKFDTEKLKGSQSLHTLYLDGPLVSNWAIQFPANLVSLQISKSEIGEWVDLMGVLGQLLELRELYIACQAYLGSQLRCTCTSFPQLKELTLSSLDSLEQWLVEEGAMNRLKKITIVDCLRLKRLPQGIRSITTLEELEVTSMPEEFCWRLGLKRDEGGGPGSSVHKQGGEDSYIIEHIPSVKLFHIIHTRASTEDYPAEESYSDSDLDDDIADSLFYMPDVTRSDDVPIDAEEAFIATESFSDSNVDDNNKKTLKSSVSGGDSLFNQTERQSHISPNEVAQLTSPTHTEIVHILHDDNKNGINKEEAKGLLFLFGEGYEFEKQMLIQLWMALGLLAEEPMEENVGYYFENLVSEGYILCSVPNSLYRVNLEKLGTEVNTKEQTCIKLDSPLQNSDSCAETLHASVVCDEINASVFKTLRGFSKLRTLLFLGTYGSRLQQVPRDLFLCYESLEALDLSGTHIKELPSSVGKMINLRYLDLSWTLLEALPEMIDRFKFLQTLNLEGCSRLHRLPDKMSGLIKLRHLHLDVLRELAAFPMGMGALVNIRTLSAFPVGTEDGLKISELKYLDHITGSFCIAKIENVQSADVAKEALLSNKKNIKKLKLRWSNHKIKHPRKEAEGILQNLCPCSDLEEIQIECYPGIKLPDWIADVSFDKLVSITLFGCVKVNMLPSMGKLPSLESLELISLSSVTKMDFKGVAADYVAFPKLQKFSVDGMLNLKTWAKAGQGDYPCIEELSIKDCPKLRQFPSVVYVPSLKHLEVSGCKSLVLESDKTLPQLEQLIVEDCPLMEDRCSKELSQRCEREIGDQWHLIADIPEVYTDEKVIQSHDEPTKQAQAGDQHGCSSPMREEVSGSCSTTYPKLHVLPSPSPSKLHVLPSPSPSKKLQSKSTPISKKHLDDEDNWSTGSSTTTSGRAARFKTTVAVAPKFRVTR